jgi:hypothetical protein
MISKRLMMCGALAALVFTFLSSSPVGAQIYFSDDFNDPAASKDKWDVITGEWKVADGVYHQLSTADPWLTSMVPAKLWNDSWDAYTIEFKVKPLTEGDAPVNVLFRVREPVPAVWADRNGPNCHMYRWIVNGYTNTESRPYIYDGGTVTMLAQTPNTLKVGVWHHIMLIVTKTSLAGYVNDVEMFDVQHAKWTNGRVGIQAYSGKMDFDDFVIYGPAYMPGWRLKAKKPDPADGAVGIQMPLFRWSAGEGAVFHNVYLGTTRELGQAQLVVPRSVLTMFYYTGALLPGTTYYWRVDEVGQDAATVNMGDVWSFVTQDVKAYYPTPADKANTMSLAPTLTWMAGVAASQHHVYFGDSNEAVRQGAAGVDKGTQTETTFAPGTLAPATSYFWRVDETVAGGAIKAGPVWTFTTPLPVDDFEGYTDAEGSRIYETWIDGWTNGTGSTVGYVQAPFAEQAIVHGGKQSMPLDYNNLKSPFYSETEREFSPVQNWTTNGIDTLSLFFRGKANNGAGKLYVAIEDSAGKVGVATNDAALTVTSWTEWKVPLSTVTGVNLAKVKKLYLGVGDRKAPVAGGAGRLYIDDIRVTKP